MSDVTSVILYNRMTNTFFDLSEFIGFSLVKNCYSAVLQQDTEEKAGLHLSLLGITRNTNKCRAIGLVPPIYYSKEMENNAEEFVKELAILYQDCIDYNLEGIKDLVKERKYKHFVLTGDILTIVL